MPLSNPARNRLAAETSPYLLQHADNPVDWYPWGDEALNRAAAAGKPILLSIGYSACHWCHVMAHESFEDDETAALMNESYVNIKVDREERPDLDRIYQTAHQLITRRSGGWPLTLFLTPDQIPFFGGTYFPKEPRHGLPGFKDLLTRVSAYYGEHLEEIAQQNRSLVEALQKVLSEAGGPSANGLNPSPIKQAGDDLLRSFDNRNGGFGRAPKFPHPTSIELLLHRWAASLTAQSEDQAALEAASFTLLRMCEGGLYDHLGGGFCRYSVDEYWMIPHFEKMLYDNGPLLGLCAELGRATAEPRFVRAATETATWVMRDMQSPEGPYYSSLDADSEGVEGKFYVWKPEQIRDVLESDEYSALALRFGLDRPANFEGSWHLHGYLEETAVAAQLGWDESSLETVIGRARQKLFETRQSRIPPARDEKILTSWNALMIKGMASASRHLDEPAYAESATRAVDFIRATLWRDGRLLAVYKDGSARLSAYLDDHAFLIEALLELLQCRWRRSDLDLAIELTEQLLIHFEDQQSGGFYFTADDHEQLINRPKPLFDDALPSGNGVAARSLLRLGHLLGEQRYLDAAERTLRWAWNAVEESPLGHTALLLATEEWLHPGQTVVLRGSGATLDIWRQRAARPYAPQRLTLAVPTEAENLPGLLEARQPLTGTTAFVCTGPRCSPPITALGDLERALAVNQAKGSG